MPPPWAHEKVSGKFSKRWERRLPTFSLFLDRLRPPRLGLKKQSKSSQFQNCNVGIEEAYIFNRKFYSNTILMWTLTLILSLIIIWTLLPHIEFWIIITTLSMVKCACVERLLLVIVFSTLSATVWQQEMVGTYWMPMVRPCVWKISLRSVTHVAQYVGPSLDFDWPSRDYCLSM